jgi:hypothetical protein
VPRRLVGASREALRSEEHDSAGPGAPRRHRTEASIDTPPNFGGGSARGRSIASLGLLCALLGLAAWSGLRGIDFGHHWDEGKQIELVKQTVTTGRLLPDRYNYPSITYELACLPLVPEVARTLAAEEKPFSKVDFPRTQERLKALVGAPAYKLEVRRVFLLLALLAPLWMFLALWSWRGPFEALYSAALLATSFELSYHSRWIAPDALVMQFTGLFLCLALRAWHSPRPARWLFAAAVAAGLATGTKYTAGLLLLPLLACLACPTVSGTPREKLRLAVILVAIWAVIYLATTPGTLLEPVRFYQDLKFERRHYEEAGHYGYTVEPGMEHALLAARYLTTALISPYLSVGLIVSALALVGLAGLLRESKALALVLFVLFPAAYFAYFATTRVLFVRNLLVLAPFLAILSARGTALLSRALPGRIARVTLVALVVAWVGADAAFVARAATTIRAPGGARDPAAEEASERAELGKACSEWLLAHPEVTVRASPEVQADLDRAGTHPANLIRDPAVPAIALAVYAEEGPTWGSWKSNRPGFALAEFGPLDVSYDWYTSWTERRLLIVRSEVAAAMSIQF